MRSITSSSLLLLALVPASGAWVLSPAFVAQSTQLERGAGGGGAVRGLLSRMGLLADEVQHFRGGMYGVIASVALNLGTRHAEISLRGAPVGGTLTGSGWLKAEHADAHSGGVVLDPDFERTLSRRFVSIQRASLDRESNTVTVTVTVPIFGQTVLVLKRVEGP
jgi:hypothetical protein